MPNASHFILYVADSARSSAFYTDVLARAPRLDVPGMTEFVLPGGGVLGLMPEHGIRNLLGSAIADPARARGVPRAELYLVVPDPRAFHRRALAAGAKELSPFLLRDWGHSAAYSLDPDGHILAFASDESPARGAPAARAVSGSVPEFGSLVPGATYRLRPGGYAIVRGVDDAIAVVRTPEGVFLPGGGQEGAEGPAEAAFREAREECGLVVRVVAEVGVADELTKLTADGTHVRKRCTFFTAELLEARPGGEADHELVWLTADEAVIQLTHASQRWALVESKRH